MAKVTEVWVVAYTERPEGHQTGGDEPSRMFFCSRNMCEHDNPTAVGSVTFANRFYLREGAAAWRDELQCDREEKLYLVKVTSKKAA